MSNTSVCSTGADNVMVTCAVPFTTESAERNKGKIIRKPAAPIYRYTYDDGVRLCCVRPHTKLRRRPRRQFRASYRSFSFPIFVFVKLTLCASIYRLIFFSNIKKGDRQSAYREAAEKV